MSSDDRRHAPATRRNREPILEALRGCLPPAGLVLEIASGTGEHARYFAEHLPDLTWQPSDLATEALLSIEGHRDGYVGGNLLPARSLDVTSEDWPIKAADAILCVNMIHIAPWSCCLGLLAGGARVLPPGGTLVLYGPFRRGGRHIAASNAAFDESLRRQDPEWGVRDLDTIEEAAASRGLFLQEILDLPRDNNVVVFVRRA